MNGFLKIKTIIKILRKKKKNTKSMDCWLLRFQVKTPIIWSPRPPPELMPANHVQGGRA